MAMRALGFEPKKEEIKKMIADIDKVRGLQHMAPSGVLMGTFVRWPCSSEYGRALSVCRALALHSPTMHTQHAVNPSRLGHLCRMAAAPSTSRSSCK